MADAANMTLPMHWQAQLNALLDRLRDAATPQGAMDAVGQATLAMVGPGLLTINAMVAAQSLLVPLQCEFFALEGLSQLMRTIDAVKAGLNGALSMQGIVLTMFDSRNKLSAMVANDVRDHFGELVYNTVVPRNVRVSEAPSFGQPVLIYDLKCPGSQAYAALAAELLRQEAKAA